MEDKPLADANEQDVQPDAQQVTKAMDKRRRLAAAIQRSVDFILSTAGPATLSRLLGTLELVERRVEQNRQRPTPNEKP